MKHRLTKLKALKLPAGVVALSLFVAFLTYLMIRVHPVLAYQFQPGKRTPFVAEQITKMFDNSGGLRHTIVSVFGQRADGSWVENRLTADGQPTGGKRIIFDVSTGKRTSIISSVKAKTTYPLTATEIARATESDSSCGTWVQDLGFQKLQRTERTTFLGTPVIKVVMQGTLRDGRVMTNERWLAPSLNCYSVKEINTTKLPGQSSGATTITEVLSIRHTAPDAALFSIDADLVEKAPSEVIEEEAQLRGETCQACQFAHGQLDNAYTSRQTR